MTVDIYKKCSLYLVDMFKDVFDYFKSSEVVAKYNFLGQNEALVSIDDKGYTFLFVYNFTTNAFGLKLQSNFLNNNNLYLVPDLIEAIEVYDIELLCKQYNKTKIKNNKYLCSFINSDNEFYEYIYFYDKDMKQYSYDEFLVYLHNVNSCPSKIVLCHKSKMILNSKEIPLYNSLFEFNLAYVLKSKICFDYIIDNVFYIDVESIGFLNLDTVFRCIKHLNFIYLYIDYNFISIEHMVEYLVYIKKILEKNQSYLKNISKEIIIDIDLQKRESIDNLYLFLMSYGQEKTLNKIKVAIRNGNIGNLNVNNYFEIHI